MAGPMHSILYIHNAILSGFRSREETAKVLNYDSKDDVNALLAGNEESDESKTSSR